jgi:DNA-directed RNA polymerase subunit RPC12/RpoP
VSSSGRAIGVILVAAGIIVGAAVAVWLAIGLSEGTLRGSGAAFGVLFAIMVVVAPLVGGGVYFLTQGRAEEKANARARGQRRLLDMLTTRGQLSIIDVAAELGETREQIEGDLYDLVGLGLFTGYVDWSKGILKSMEYSQLQGRQTCPNCGGQLELAGKGLIKCPYCGAEIFLGPEGPIEVAPPAAQRAVSAGGGTR